MGDDSHDPHWKDVASPAARQRHRAPGPGGVSVTPVVSATLMARRYSASVDVVQAHAKKCRDCKSALLGHAAGEAPTHMCHRGQALIGAAHVARLAARERRAA